MGNFNLSFTAVLSLNKKYNIFLGKSGKSGWDKEYEKGKITGGWKSEICHCLMNKEEFIAVRIKKETSFGITLFPEATIPLWKRKKTEELYDYFPLSEVIDFKGMESFIGGKRLVINTMNNYVSIQPVTNYTVAHADQNLQLIQMVHEQYKKLGIRPMKGAKRLREYEEPFLNWFLSVLRYCIKQKYIQLKPRSQSKVCPKHKITGKYISEHNAYLCEKCKDFIRK
jgi:hypothetical protein